MNSKDLIDTLSGLASIATAIVAVWAYGAYRWNLHKRKESVETLLAEKARPGDDSLTIEQVAGELMLTREQVLEAASRSAKIKGTTGPFGNERRLRYVQDSN